MTSTSNFFSRNCEIYYLDTSNVHFYYLYLCHQSSNNTLITSGIYRLQCKTCKKSYVGQTGRFCNSTTSRTHKIHKNQQSSICIRDAYYQQPCKKGKLMNCWESLYIQTLQQQHLLLDEQKINESNPLYSLANTSHHNTQFHNNSVDTRHTQP